MSAAVPQGPPNAQLGGTAVSAALGTRLSPSALLFPATPDRARESPILGTKRTHVKVFFQSLYNVLDYSYNQENPINMINEGGDGEDKHFFLAQVFFPQEKTKTHIQVKSNFFFKKRK